MKKLIISIILITSFTYIHAQEVEPVTDPQSETEADQEIEDDPAFKKIDDKDQKKEQEFEDESDDSVEVRYYQAPVHSDRKKRNRRNDIKTLTGGMSHSGGFGALTFRSTRFKGENMVLIGGRGGWIINRTLAIGLEGHGIIPTTKYENLNPTPGGEAKVVGGYGGMFLEPIFFSNEVVHITFPVSAGAGWMGYDEHTDDGTNQGDDFISDDVYWYAEPGVALEVNIARNFRMGFGVSKRFTQDLKLFNTAKDDFNTTNYFLTLKIGAF